MATASAYIKAVILGLALLMLAHDGMGAPSDALQGHVVMDVMGNIVLTPPVNGSVLFNGINVVCMLDGISCCH